MGFPGGTVVKNPPANAGNEREMGSISGSGRSSGGGNGNPLQYSCLNNVTDSGAGRLQPWDGKRVGQDFVTKQQQRLNYSNRDPQNSVA